MFSICADSPAGDPSSLTGVSRTLGFADPTPQSSARRKLDIQESSAKKMLTSSAAEEVEGKVVDAHDWENIKENAKPIKRGRRISKLNQFARESLGTAASSAGGLSVRMSAVKLKKERQDKLAEFEEKIAAASADPAADALKPWLEYIRWCEDEYPEGGIQSRQLVLLERCCRSLLKDERYRNDVRYLKCWLKYADLLEDPHDLFRFLCVNRIGELCSLFYVAWALVSEQRKNYGLTDKIFTRGKRIKAKPSKMLEQRHRQFQRRMARKWLRQEQGEDDAAHIGRLSEAGNDNDRRDPHQNDENGGNSRGRNRVGLAGGVANTRLGRNASRSRSNGSRKVDHSGVSTLGNFSIFVEGEDGAENSTSASGGALTAEHSHRGNTIHRRYDDLVDGSPGSIPATWDFQGKNEVVKENDGPITRWNEAGLQLVGKRGRAAERLSRRTRGGANFEICVDEEEDVRIKTATKANKSSHPHKNPPDTVNLRRRLEGYGRTASEKEALDLFRDPLKNFRLAGENLGDALDTEKLSEPKIMPPPPPVTSSQSCEPMFAPPPAPSSKQNTTSDADHFLCARPKRSKGSVKGGYDASLLGEKEVYSFEEHRAAMMKRRLHLRLLEKKKKHEEELRKEREKKENQEKERQERIQAERDVNLKIKQKPKVPQRLKFAAGSAGKLSKSCKAAAAAASRRKERRATMCTLRDVDDMLSSSDEEEENVLKFSKPPKQHNSFFDALSDSSDEDEHSIMAGGNSIKAAPKALSFSNCSSTHMESNGKPPSGKNSAKRGLDFGAQCTATPMTAPENSYAATRKLMFGSDMKESSARKGTIPKPKCEVFSDSSDDEADETTQNQGAGAKQHSMNELDTSMTCNLRAAMEDLGDLFGSPGLGARNDNEDVYNSEEKQPFAAVIDENDAPSNAPPNNFKVESRSIHKVEPDSVLRSLSEHEYQSVPPTETESQSEDDEEFVENEPTHGIGLLGGGDFHIFNEEEGTQDITDFLSSQEPDNTVNAALANQIFDDGTSDEEEGLDSNGRSTANILASANEILGENSEHKSSDSERADSPSMDSPPSENNTCNLIANTMDMLSLGETEEEDAKLMTGTVSSDKPTIAASKSPAFSILCDVFGGESESATSTLESVGRDGSDKNQLEIMKEREDDTAEIDLSNLHDLSSICCEDEENATMSHCWSDAPSVAPSKSSTKSKSAINVPFSIFTD